MNEIGIKCYQTLLEMEVENQKINELIMAPKFAKLLNESVDQTDFVIHKNKTIEIVSEFVDKSISNTNRLSKTIKEQLEDINANKRLIMACEMKMKSLTREDRDNFLLENSNILNSIYEAKAELTKDIQCVSKALSKILESSFESKEEYSKIMKNFRNTVSECTSKLDKIDISNMEKGNVSVEEVSDILNSYKSTQVTIESDMSSLGDLKDISIDPNNVVKVREAVYLGTSYLMKANSVMGKLVEVSHENSQDILTQFVTYEAEESNIQFESAMNNIIRQNSMDDDYDNFI